MDELRAQEITIYTFSCKLIKVIVLENIASARKQMAKENVDALIVKQPHNLYYMSGWTPKVTARPILAVVPLENETTLIIPEIEETTSRRYADQIKKIITYSENQYNLFEASARTLKKVIEDMSLTKGRIGIEEDFLPVHYYRFLKNNLPEIELVDADSLIWRLRMIKSGRQIENMKRASELAKIGMDILLDVQEAGKTELEINMEAQNRFSPRAHELYSEDKIQVEGGVLSGWKTVDPHELPSGKHLEKGETVKNLMGGTLNNYYTALHRTTVVGRPTDDQKFRWETLVEAQRKALKLVKPGTKVCDVHNAIKQVRDEAGLGNFRAHSPHAHDQARTGSGQGLHYHEPPYLRASDETELTPGMVITVQPQLNDPAIGMGFGIGDSVLITKDGHEILTEFRKDTIY